MDFFNGMNLTEVCMVCNKKVEDYEKKVKSKPYGFCLACTTMADILKEYRSGLPTALVFNKGFYRNNKISQQSSKQKRNKGFGGRKFTIFYKNSYFIEHTSGIVIRGGKLDDNETSDFRLYEESDDLFYYGKVQGVLADSIEDNCIISPDPWEPRETYERDE